MMTTTAIEIMDWPRHKCIGFIRDAFILCMTGVADEGVEDGHVGLFEYFLSAIRAMLPEPF